MESLLQFISTFIKCISGTIKMTSIFLQIVQFILRHLMTISKHPWIVYPMIGACLFFGTGVIAQFVWEKVKYYVVYFIAFLFGRFILNKLIDLYNYWTMSTSNEFVVLEPRIHSTQNLVWE